MRYFLCLLLIFVFFGCATDKKENSLNIAVAANMKYAIDSLTNIFNDLSGVDCIITANSSGMLTAQIEKGAPYDLFLSANMMYPNRIAKLGLGEEPKIYAHGVLVAVYKNGLETTSLEELLSNPKVERIGIADPKTAPYGMAAKEFLESSGQINQIEDKIVTAESVGQLNQFITTHNVNVGFTSRSFTVGMDRQFDYFEVPLSKYESIKQGMQMLKHGKENNPEITKEFLTFMQSPKAKDILNFYGYNTDL